MENPKVGTSGLVATFVSGSLRLLKNKCPEENLVPNENPKIGKSWLGATFVSGAVLFLKNATQRKCCPEGKSASGKLRAGTDFRCWNFAVSQNLSP